MIFVKKGTDNKLKTFNKDNLIIVADFDATLTTSNSKTSWSVLTESGSMPKEFYDEINTLYRKYAPFELDMLITESLKEDLMAEWSKVEFEALFKHKYKEECIQEAFEKNSHCIKLRKGVKNFLTLLHNLNIPIFIISAGISNVIEIVLKNNNAMYDNIKIISNKIIFENKIATRLENEIVHIFNKNVIAEQSLAPILNTRNKVLLFGDIIQDTTMCGKINDNNIIKVGFFEKPFDEMFPYYKSQFDLVCTNNTSALEIAKVILGKTKGIKYLY